MFGDTAALRALTKQSEGALCTIVAIDGSYSRRLGAQLAIFSDNSIAGSLADGCLEAQLIRERRAAGISEKALLLRFGRGSAMIDFQLPCGSGIDIVIDPAPDMANIRRAVTELDHRCMACLPIPVPGRSDPFLRVYNPELRLVILGTGPECEMLCAQAEAFGITPEWFYPLGRPGGSLSLGKAPDITLDQWTAVAILFHDHEWEHTLLPWALTSEAFYVGAQGGSGARDRRMEMLRQTALRDDQLRRLSAPVGLIPHTRDPSVLGLSILAEIVAEYELVGRRMVLSDQRAPVSVG